MPQSADYPKKRPRDARPGRPLSLLRCWRTLTEEVVRENATLLEARGFPPFTDEDIGRLHLLLYDLLYEGHEDSVRLQ